MRSKPAADSADYRFISDERGRQAARFLDRDLIRPQASKVSTGSDGSPRLIPDDDVSTGAALVRARVRGIDEIAVCRAWKAAERALARERGRDVRQRVIAMIESRERELGVLRAGRRRR